MLNPITLNAARAPQRNLWRADVLVNLEVHILCYLSIGDWIWTWCLITKVQRVPLTLMSLNPICEEVETAQGVAVTVSAVAQCKVMKEKQLLFTAAEQFLGTSMKKVTNAILQTLEGHLRAILGTLNGNYYYSNQICLSVCLERFISMAM